MPTKKQPSENTSPIQPKPAESGADEDFDPVVASNVIKKIKAQHSPITDARRKAYRARSSDADADKLGTQTSSADVRQGASAWAVTIHETLQKSPVGLVYAAPRFVWFIECFEALHAAIVDEENRRSKQDGVLTEEAHSFQIALAARSVLYSAMLTFSQGRAVERTALGKVSAKTDKVQTLSKSIGGLAKLADAWLALEDETSVILAEDANLTEDTVAAARDAVIALSSKAVGVTMEGPVKTRDTPAINRAEGRMLFEMKEARRLFNEANERNHLVPRLTPLPSIAHAFGRRTSGGSGGSGEVEPAGDEAVPTPG